MRHCKSPPHSMHRASTKITSLHRKHRHILLATRLRTLELNTAAARVFLSVQQATHECASSAASGTVLTAAQCPW